MEQPEKSGDAGSFCQREAFNHKELKEPRDFTFVESVGWEGKWGGSGAIPSVLSSQGRCLLIGIEFLTVLLAVRAGVPEPSWRQ